MPHICRKRWNEHHCLSLLYLNQVHIYLVITFSAFVDNQSTSTKEKTILMIGMTGAGKSTLIDGLANHVLQITLEDPFRFKLVTLEREEEENAKDSVCS